MWALVGSAGRKEDAPRFTAQVYNNAVQSAEEIQDRYDIRSWVSGGAAYSDHIAIALGLKAKKVERKVSDAQVALIMQPDVIMLHLPCPIAIKNGKPVFVPEVNGKWYCQAWEARTANYYHEGFSRKLFKDPFASRNQILELIAKGLDPLSGITVHVNSGGGLLGRNVRVADDATEGILAFTFSGGKNYPKDGGTANTWRTHFQLHPEAQRIHVDLGAL
jgi:hypothetical protein